MFEGREQMTFGIPKKRVEKINPYEGQCLLIMHKAPETKGGTYKFELTKLALEELGLVKTNAEDEKLVSFSFDGLEPVLGNTTDLKGKIDASAQYNVSMSGIFSNKPVYEYLTQLYGLNNDVDNLFNLDIDDESGKIATIYLTELDEAATASPADFKLADEDIENINIEANAGSEFDVDSKEN